MTNPPGDGAASERRAVLCADDFAQTRATVEGILSLLEVGRLSAVSCLVESPLWADAGVRLRSRPATFDIGLHLNLTHDFAGGGHRPAALPLTMLAAWSRTIDRNAVARRLDRQFDLFEDIIGRPPDFVDGHQHVHQLPVVRDILISVLHSRGLAPSIAIRVTVPSQFRGLKGWIVAALGGRGLLETVRAQGMRHNSDFAGVYDFYSPHSFAERMSQWLDDLRDGGLIMCHPARKGPAKEDPIALARAHEYVHLRSDAFLSEVGWRQVRLVRFRDLPFAREGA